MACHPLAVDRQVRSTPVRHSSARCCACPASHDTFALMPLQQEPTPLAYARLALAVLNWAGIFVIGRALCFDIPAVALTFWRWASSRRLPLAACAATGRRHRHHQPWQFPDPAGLAVEHGRPLDPGRHPVLGGLHGGAPLASAGTGWARLADRDLGSLRDLPCTALRHRNGERPHAGTESCRAAGIAYVGLFASVLAYIGWNRGVAIIGPARAAPFMYLMRVFTPSVDPVPRRSAARLSRHRRPDDHRRHLSRHPPPFVARGRSCDANLSPWGSGVAILQLMRIVPSTHLPCSTQFGSIARGTMPLAPSLRTASSSLARHLSRSANSIFAATVSRQNHACASAAARAPGCAAAARR